MRNSQAFRTLLIGFVFITGALSVMRFFEGDTSRDLDDELTPPRIIHVARETKPTIVRPKDDWLQQDAKANQATHDPLAGDEVNSAQYLAPPVPLDDVGPAKTLRR